MQRASNKRKRILLEEESYSNLSLPNFNLTSNSKLKRRTSNELNIVKSSQECGRLVTVDDNKGERGKYHSQNNP